MAGDAIIGAFLRQVGLRLVDVPQVLPVARDMLATLAAETIALGGSAAELRLRARCEKAARLHRDGACLADAWRESADFSA